MDEFARSFAQLRRDNCCVSLVVFACALCVAVLWGTWLYTTRIDIYVTTDVARLESASRIYPLDAPVSGRIKVTHLALGQEVRAGDVLIEFDTEGLLTQINTALAHLAALNPEVQKVSAAIDAGNSALRAAQRTAAIKINQARLQAHGAQLEDRMTGEIARRYEADRGAAAYVEVLRVEEDAQIKATASQDLRMETRRLEADSETQASDRKAALEQLESQRAALQGEITTTEAELKQLQYDVHRRSLRSLINGHVASISDIGVGSFVHEGSFLGTVVPVTTVIGIAEFPAATALGRVHPGQHAWLHLSGFPWMRYGSVSAAVSKIASEPLN